MNRCIDVLLPYPASYKDFAKSPKITTFYGGAQSYYGVTPDLAALGKGLGGGYPIGAIVGRADIMGFCAEAELRQFNYV